jgi:hypothetical protein
LSTFITYSLPSGLSVGRSNIKQVAERRRVDIERFLNSLFRMADEISHSDIVYTFFHPLLRDQQEANINATKVKGNCVCVVRNVALAAVKSAANSITDPTSPCNRTFVENRKYVEVLAAVGTPWQGDFWRQEGLTES